MVELKNVAFVPEFSKSLVSVRRLWKDNRIKTKFGEKNVLKMQDGTKIPFAQQGGMYTTRALIVENVPDVPANLLHARMGHCHWNKIVLASKRSNGQLQQGMHPRRLSPHTHAKLH